MIPTLAAMIQVPPYLRKGSTIGLVCPAGYMAPEKVTTCCTILQQWGFQVKVGATVGKQHHYFAGTDMQRLNDLQHMLNDDSVEAVMAARGGYGTSRIIDYIDWRVFQKKPKWIIGYSDITVLHCHLLATQQVASIHAPMAGAFDAAGGTDAYTDTLKLALMGKRMLHRTRPHPFNRSGKANGLLAGGNLALLAHLVGTPSMPNLRDTILFIEDVGEYLYNIDRMLLQLDRAGHLRHLAGVVVGSFSDMKDTTTPFGNTLEEIIKKRLAAYKYPVLYGFPVGHTPQNVALRVGLPAMLHVTAAGEGKLTCDPF